MPSSNQQCDIEKQCKIDLAQYEVVQSSEIVFPNFSLLKRLGRGSYGMVVQCYFRGRIAAAKLLKTNIDYVHNEAKILHKFKHKNIVELYAAFKGEHCGLVLELMAGGSLSDLLHKNLHIKYQACHVLGWSIQVASALCYLHSHGYVYRDLKPSNLLLTSDYITLKLCDFGTAAYLCTSMTNNRGSAAWMAPEVFCGKKYDQKCDIFSFGILLWEMIARKQPFDDKYNNPYTILWHVSDGRRPCHIIDCPKPIMDLMLRCWSDDPIKRPYISEVVNNVEALCEIFPNRFIPLIDCTTGKKAIAKNSSLNFCFQQS